MPKAPTYTIAYEAHGHQPLDRVRFTPATNAVRGALKISWTKVLFVGGNLLIALIFAVPTFSFSALGVMIGLMVPTLWLGHSVGFHRLIVHRSFSTPAWVENILALLGTLVGMGGIYGVVQLHDERDWAQRQGTCHPYFSHELGFWRDAFAQLFMQFEFDEGPEIDLSQDRRPFLDLLDRYWWAWHGALALVLFAIGGFGFVVWGLSLRIVISLFGHWTVVYVSHTQGEVPKPQPGAAVQGHNIPWLAWLSFGEAWHCYHHAYPRSAKLDLETEWQDPSYLAILAMGKLGLAHDIALPKAD